MKLFFNKKPTAPINVSVYENYEALVYPKEGGIDSVEDLDHYLYFENESNLPNGSLFSNGDSVFFVSRGEYRPILASEIFEKLGFNWNDVIPRETGIFSSLKGEGEKIVFSSAHPDGTIIKVDNEYFLVWEKKLIKIKDEIILKEAWGDFFAVSADDLKMLDSCVIQNGEKNCSLNISNSSDINLPLIFEIEKDPNLKIIDAETRLRVSTKISDFKKSFLIMLFHIKEDIVSRYGDYLFSI